MSKRSRAKILTIVGLALCAGATLAQPAFTTFESGPVRPVALSPDATRLFVTNIPDNRLEIFSIEASHLEHTHSVPVGLEPVAVAPRNNSEVWVVNHLSDSVSIVDVTADPPRVIRTLWVGDEPRDIVFAGGDGERAFITTAHRGQNVPYDPQLTTPGVGRADVWVFDAANLGSSAGGTPLTIVTLFGDTPRALAASPDGSTVYAAIFHSGNQTTVLNEELVCNGDVDAICQVDGSNMPGGMPEPRKRIDGMAQPEVGLIVRYDRDNGAWRDELGRDWRDAVRFDLPDYDVFAIDADADTPIETARFPHVGTILFNMVANPASGKIYVSNTEASNEIRFEGPALEGTTTVRSRLHRARISVIDPTSGNIESHHLNPHIDYDTVPSPAGTKEKSLATPLQMVSSGDGSTLYLAAFGSSAIGIIDTAELEAGQREPSTENRIEVGGGGPAGLALDENVGALYLLTRFDNAVRVIDLSTRNEIQRIGLHNPEPLNVTDGRRFLYDADLSSSNGEASCAACHVFGDVDDLAWDLGNPDGEVIEAGGIRFHPMKGPMTVQTLRGLDEHGAMHWRGERNATVDPGGDVFDERTNFGQFNGAFVDLLGRNHELTNAQMASYTDFVLQIIQPPNPVRALDNQLNPQEQRGRDLYFDTPFIFSCETCHTLAPENGLFGTNGTQTPALETQQFKTPQLRNMYQRVGMFGVAPLPFFGGGSTDNSHTGDQIRGFGYIHDGSVDSLFRFLSAGIFGLRENLRRDIEAFLLAFDSNLAPVVGQQVTIDDETEADGLGRLDLLIARAIARECDLSAQGVANGEQRGWFFRIDSAEFTPDHTDDPALSKDDLIAAAADAPITFTCAPPGSGERIAIDRDGDGIRNRDELEQGSNPADPQSPNALCAGDCDANGAVSINELIRAVGIALGDIRMALCPGIDSDGNGDLAISELIAAVRNALDDCG